MTVEFVAYEHFPEDLRRLSVAAKRTLHWLLETLDRNPYDPALKAATVENDIYGYDLGGYFVYWKLHCDAQTLSVTPSPQDTPIKVLLLGMRADG